MCKIHVHIHRGLFAWSFVETSPARNYDATTNSYTATICLPFKKQFCSAKTVCQTHNNCRASWKDYI